ncbi:protein kinase [Plantactinospora sp. GCM10030261]|uniref:serine/threonine-protein kinase n=1 Tax=Plantactinospora sp. GCM10030261 TaxID=3273420 RepID=UPI00360A36F7
MSRVGLKLAGRYKITGQLGQGGLGAVYAAHDRVLERTVAVKLLASTAGREQLGRFRREAKVLAMFKHPNVVSVFDVGWHEGGIFVVMEHVAGPDLGEILYAAGERLPVDQVLRYAVPLSDALAHLHGHQPQVIHRDLKPQNIIVDDDGTVKICDFGLAVAPDAMQTRYTQPGTRMGTPAYMSPEQCLGLDPGPGSDLYSFGAVLYTLLTNGPPFGIDGAFNEYAKRVINEAPRPVTVCCPEAPPGLAALVHDLLAKDPAARPTAPEVRDILAALAAPPRTPGRTLPDPTVPTSPAGPAPTLPDPARPTLPDPARPTLPDPATAEADVATLVPSAAEETIGDGPRDTTTVRRPRDDDSGRALEAGEVLLRQGDYARADRHFTELAHRLRAEDRAAGEDLLAAEFGRIRSRFGLGGEAAAALRLVRLSVRAEATLGREHPLVREIRAYLDEKAG